MYMYIVCNFHVFVNTQFPCVHILLPCVTKHSVELKLIHTVQCTCNSHAGISNCLIQ